MRDALIQALATALGVMLAFLAIVWIAWRTGRDVRALEGGKRGGEQE